MLSSLDYRLRLNFTGCLNCWLFGNSFITEESVNWKVYLLSKKKTELVSNLCWRNLLTQLMVCLHPITEFLSFPPTPHILPHFVCIIPPFLNALQKFHEYGIRLVFFSESSPTLGRVSQDLRRTCKSDCIKLDTRCCWNEYEKLSLNQTGKT